MKFIPYIILVTCLVGGFFIGTVYQKDQTYKDNLKSENQQLKNQIQLQQKLDEINQKLK